jgi:hypothetical protein
VLLRQGDQLREGAGVADREVGEDLAVNLDARLAQALNESVVGDAVGPGSGVDPLDPELAELALAGPAVAVCVAERMADLLLGLAVQARPLPAVASRQLEGLPALLLGVHCPLDACHCR